jgi:hypothetical protein
LEFGVFSLRVIHSLHGILQRAPNMPPIPGPPPPEIFPPDAKPPFHLRDYVQGGTLAYFIRLNGVKLLVFGSLNYIEREVEGLRPDAAAKYSRGRTRVLPAHTCQAEPESSRSNQIGV